MYKNKLILTNVYDTTGHKNRLQVEVQNINSRFRDDPATMPYWNNLFSFFLEDTTSIFQKVYDRALINSNITIEELKNIFFELGNNISNHYKEHLHSVGDMPKKNDKLEKDKEKFLLRLKHSIEDASNDFLKKYQQNLKSARHKWWNTIFSAIAAITSIISVIIGIWD